MNHLYTKNRMVNCIALFLAIAVLSTRAYSQTANQYIFSTTAGTYTPLTLPLTTGAIVGTPTANTVGGSQDDFIYTLSGFPFSFNFLGTAYTSCKVSTNGFITFGTTAAAAGEYTPLSATTGYNGAVSGFARDLNTVFNVASDTGSLRWDVVGTAPNREVVIEWKSWRPAYTTSTTNAFVFNMQIRLEETTNNVKIVYGPSTYLVGSTNISNAVQIGLRGAANTDFNNRTNASSNFSVTTAGTGNGSTVTYNTAAPVNFPSNGLTYTFTPPPACSATPPVGTVSLAAATTCTNNFTLNQTFPGVTGITYQWQESTALAGSYTNVVAGGTSQNYSAAAPSATTYYQVVVTCTASGLTATSAPIAIDPPAINGGTAGISAQPGCSTPGFTVNVTGATTGTLTYQWQDSIPGGAWANIVTATSTTYAAAANVSTPTFFRRNTMCVSSLVTSSSAPVMVQAVAPGTANSTNAVCGDSITLSLTGNTSGAGVTYQWEESTDSSIWSPISSATAASQKIPSPSAVMFYRAQVTCGAGSAFSVPKKVLPLINGSTSITSSICTDSTLLALTGSTTGASLTYQWLSSTDSIVWVPVGSATSATYKFPSPGSTMYYRNILTCGLSTDTSVAVKVVEPCQGFKYSVARNTGVAFSTIQPTGSTFTWNNATSGDDDRTNPVYFPAGFNFTYSGTVRPAFYVCTNGWLSFDTANYSTAWTNDMAATTPKYIVAPFWEDLVTLGNTPANKSYIKYELTGTAPNRVMTVEWAEMERYLYGSPNLNFQVKFYEGTNDIEYIYGRMQPFDGNGTGDFNYSIGMIGTTPANGQRLSLAFENSTNFTTGVFNNNTIAPACNSSLHFTAGGTFVPTVTSPVPANDSSAFPVVLTVNPLPCIDGCGTYYTSRGATASGTAIAPTTGTPDDDVWFRFTAPVSGQVNISTFASSGYNPAFQVMTTLFDTAGMGAAASVNANSNALESAMVTTLTPGTDYLVRMFNAGTGAGSTSGAFSICINEVIPPPANDDTTGAILLTAAPACTPTAGTTLGSTASAVPVCGGLPDDDVWYKFIPNNSVDTVTVVGSGTFRAYVEFLNAGLQSVGCLGTATNGGTVKFSVSGLEQDSTYFIRVYHANAGTASANFNICITGDNATAPVLTTDAASGVVDVVATVSGSIVSSGGFPVIASGIVYGTSLNPAIGGPGVVDSATTPLITSGAISFSLTGLTASTTYHFRTYAINGIGTSYGPDSSFTTTAGPVLATVETLPADSISGRSARVNGNILFDGSSVITASGILTSTSSASMTIGDPSVTDYTTVPVVTTGSYSFSLSLLSASTKYYFRSYAINGVGTAYSAIDSFETTPVIDSFPYDQNFDSGADLWTVETDPTYANNWVLGTPGKTYLSGAHSGANAWTTLLAGVYDNNVRSSVVSPQFDFTSITSGDPVLRFYHKFVTEQNWDAMIVQISVNGGAWTKLDPTVGTGTNYNTANSYAWYSHTGTSGPVAPPKFSSITSGVGTDVMYSSADNGWIESATVLTGAAGQSNVKVRFYFGSDGSGQYEGFALDDIHIEEVVTPVTPASAVVLTNITDVSTDVSWTNGDGMGRLVVARLTTTPAIAPTNNTLYEATNFFAGTDSTGLSNYIVYHANASTVSVNGLTEYTDYTYDVYEYNGKYMHIKFTAATSNNASTVPVTLTTFTGTAKAKDAFLKWTTASEINNKGFEVERSADGRNFEYAGFVKGAGNSTKLLNYTFTDAKAFEKTPVMYYRLKQVDFDGKITYSQVVRINSNAQSANAVSAYPNPFGNTYRVSFDAVNAGTVNLKMVDLQGKVVAEQTTEAIKGSNEVTFEKLDQLQTGIYFVKVTIGGEIQVLKLVKN
jgi:hypothetical protein